MLAEANAIFATHGVSKRYRARGPLALDDVSLALPAGSITALVGPNGAGKSTLIRAAVGFERPTSGHVTIDGLDPWRRRAAALARVGYVPQFLSLYQVLSIDDHVRLARGLRQTFDERFARTWVTDRGIGLDRAVGDLSGGEQAQVALALALATRAPLMLLDEPLAALDPLARREFVADLVAGARRDATTVLLASHVTADVGGLVDRIVVLGAGRVMLHAAVDDAIANHWVAGPEDDADPAAAVASYPGRSGEVRVLVRGSRGTSQGTPATLDDVVLGYLALARGGAPSGRPA
jgi:ABC-2 type transport system ATP-binding protein